MINLPSISEQALGVSLEGPWGSDVVLISPTGERITARGQVTNEFKQVGADSRGIAHGGRNTMTVYRSVVVLRRSSLSIVPQNGENWACQVPENPGEEPTVMLYLEQVPDGSRTLGLVTLRLTKMKQS